MLTSAENADLAETPNLTAALAHARHGWCAYCCDCDQWSGPLKDRSAASLWPQFHREQSPTCRAPEPEQEPQDLRPGA